MFSARAADRFVVVNGVVVTMFRLPHRHGGVRHTLPEILIAPFHLQTSIFTHQT